MRHLQSLLVFLVTIYFVNASEELKLNFQNLHRVPDEYSENTSPLYFLTFDTLRVRFDTIPENDLYIPLKFPDMRNSKDTAFFKEFFQGWANSPFQRQNMFLVGNYKSDTTYIWADLNNNLDFTDDGEPFIISENNPHIYVGLPNKNNPEGKFLYKFGKKKYEDTASRNRINEHFYNDDETQGFVTTNCDYWFGCTRLNILSCDTIIDGNKIQIGLMDWNCNGLYADIDTISENNWSSDRVLVGEYGNEIISYKPSAGAVSLLPETLIPINGIFYKLLEVEPTGKYIRIVKTDRTYQILKVGDDLPDLTFPLVSGEQSSLRKHIQLGKLNLIDIWGFWCKGCLLAIPKLKAMDSLYSNKLNIIGLHCYESNPKKAISTIEKNNIQWTNGFLTSEIEKTLLSSGGFPYYILVDEKGKIKKFDIYLNELEELLNE